jgi:hypothetical protein
LGHEVSVTDDEGNPLGSPLAVKRLGDGLSVPEGEMQEIRQRFEREARLLDDVLDHPNIVP